LKVRKNIRLSFSLKTLYNIPQSLINKSEIFSPTMLSSVILPHQKLLEFSPAVNSLSQNLAENNVGNFFSQMSLRVAKNNIPFVLFIYLF
jgi:hypothetical protein